MEHNNTQLALHLTKHNIPVTITAVGENTYTRMPPYYSNTLDIEEIPWPHDPYTKPPTLIDWYRIMRARPADIAFFPKSWWSKGGLSMMIAAKLVYNRIVVREEGAQEFDSPRGQRYFGVFPRLNLWHRKHIAYSRLLTAVPDKIICVSDSVRHRLLEGCGYPPERTVTVHNAVDSSLFRFDAGARHRVRRMLGIPNGSLVFGAVGRIDNIHKRHDASLRQFSRLVAAYPSADLRFLLVGEGPDLASMQELAESLGIKSRVTFGPFTPTPWEAHSALDVFLMPSSTESFGIALIEAMACKRCVIGTAIEGITEILNDSEIGFAISLEENELYSAMERALQLGPEGRKAMGEAARESVRRRFDADRQYMKIIQLILGQD